MTIAWPRLRTLKPSIRRARAMCTFWEGEGPSPSARDWLGCCMSLWLPVVSPLLWCNVMLSLNLGDNKTILEYNYFQIIHIVSCGIRCSRSHKIWYDVIHHIVSLDISISEYYLFDTLCSLREWCYVFSHTINLPRCKMFFQYMFENTVWHAPDSLCVFSCICGSGFSFYVALNHSNDF